MTKCSVRGKGAYSSRVLVGSHFRRSRNNSDDDLYPGGQQVDSCDQVNFLLLRPAGRLKQSILTMSASSSRRSLSLQKELPPEPDPEPDLPFDFHRFLEQLRHRSADPVAKFLRSFLGEFGKKQWMVHEQVKIITDFLTFITNKMAQCDIWRGVSDAEFDNAREGMEKLVMNRLYTQTFSPAITSGRRGQHQEDIERDSVLAQKIRIYKWVREEHLDLKPVSDSGRRFLILAQQGSYFIDFTYDSY